MIENGNETVVKGISGVAAARISKRRRHTRQKFTIPSPQRQNVRVPGDFQVPRRVDMSRTYTTNSCVRIHKLNFNYDFERIKNEEITWKVSKPSYNWIASITIDKTCESQVIFKFQDVSTCPTRTPRTLASEFTSSILSTTSNEVETKRSPGKCQNLLTTGSGPSLPTKCASPKRFSSSKTCQHVPHVHDELLRQNSRAQF